MNLFYHLPGMVFGRRQWGKNENMMIGYYNDVQTNREELTEYIYMVVSNF